MRSMRIGGTRLAPTRSGGAAAVSVLTEPSRFDGSLRAFARGSRGARAVGVPAMRKDFLVDPYQVLEARAAGAGGVLVIVRMLSRERIVGVARCRRRAGHVRTARSLR